MGKEKELINEEGKVEFNENTLNKYKDMLCKICRKAIRENPSLWRITFDDLYGECMIALADSCRGYSASKGTMFSTYLYTAATNRVNAYIREQCRPYKINQNMNKTITAVAREMNKDPNATIESVSKNLNIPEAEVMHALEHRNFAYSLDWTVESSRGGEDVGVDQIITNDKEEDSPEDIVRQILENNKSMTPLEKEIFCKYKGIIGFTSTSKRQLCKQYDKTPKEMDKILRVASWKFNETALAQKYLYLK